MTCATIRVLQRLRSLTLKAALAAARRCFGVPPLSSSLPPSWRSWRADWCISSVQHVQRSYANDPQIQLAESAAAALNAGAMPAEVIGPGTVDVGINLAPFVVVYDTSGNVLATSGQLDGHDPVPPKGVLESAQQSGEDIVTWQPRTGVRVAAVAVPWQGGTVMAGRSLRLVEQREDDSLPLAGAAVVVMLFGVAAASLLAAWAWPAVSGPGRPR